MKKWVAQYALDGKNHHLGTFGPSGQLEAALMWDDKQRQLGRTGAPLSIHARRFVAHTCACPECNFPRAGETRAVAGAPAPRESAPVPRSTSRESSRRKQPQLTAPPTRARAALEPEPAPAMPAAKRARAAPSSAAAPALVSPPPPTMFQEAAEEAAAQVARILRGLGTPPAGARAVTEGTAAPQLLPMPESRIGASPTFPWNALASPPGRSATLRGGAAAGNGTPLTWLDEGWPGMLLRPLAAGGSSASGSGGHSGSGSGSSGHGRRGARAPPADEQSLWDLRPLFPLSALRGGRRASRDSSGGIDAGAPPAAAPDAGAAPLALRSTPRRAGGGKATRR